MEWITDMSLVDSDYTQEDDGIGSYEFHGSKNHDSHPYGFWMYMFLLPDNVTEDQIKKDLEDNPDLLLNIIREHGMEGENKDNLEYSFVDEEGTLYLNIQYTCDPGEDIPEFEEEEDDDDNEFDMYPEESGDN